MATDSTDSPVTSQEDRPIGAFFDLDKTLISTSSTLAFWREFMNNGLISVPEALHIIWLETTYMIRGHNDERIDAMKDHMMEMVKGWDEDQVRRISEQAMNRVITPTIYGGAADLLDWHRHQGHEVTIISASPSVIVEPIAEVLGITRVVATELDVEGGRFTGGIRVYRKGAAKAAAMREITRDRGYDLAECYAYSDSVTDLPMLEAVGHAVAINPDRELRHIAQAQGWQVLTFRHRTVRSFLGWVASSIGVGASAAMVVASAGLWVWMRRRCAGITPPSHRSRGWAVPPQLAASCVAKVADRLRSRI